MVKAGKHSNSLLFLNILTILFLIALPYYLFSGKLFIGGDDTRLFYIFPLDFLRNVTFFSWYKVSSLGINGPSQYLFPFLCVWYFISLFVKSQIVINYLAFSLPFILGFVYFQKAIKELFKPDQNQNLEIFLGGLFYVLSPILIINQMFVFLISVWLIGLLPIILYYFIRYLRTGHFKYVFIASIWCFFLAFALYAIPWLAGFILPLIFGLLICSFLFNKKDKLQFIKQFVIFAGYIFATQAFWIYGFILTYLNLGEDSFASKFVSKGFVDTFTPTILSTATGNIMYPLLNLFHRQIPFDFSWKLKDIFLTFYDKTFLLNCFFFIIFLFGIISYKKFLNKLNSKLYLIILVSFIFSLYFFTVNIGPLKDVFIFMGKIPGFTMFRNFYDKFAVGYVIFYSSLITLGLLMLTRKYVKQRAIILFFFVALVLLNSVPIKQTVNSPLWTTKDIYKIITIPEEYMDFMKLISDKVSSTNNILNVPLGSSEYSIIKDTTSNNVYAGVSPVKIFSGVTDISGHYSFNYTDVADKVDSVIVNRQYDDLKRIMKDHNINYVLVTKNIPSELIDSYLFNTDLYKAQDNSFLKAITDKKIYMSSNGNYELYSVKSPNSLISSEKAIYKKNSQVKYDIYLKGIKSKQELIFNDSYHGGWKLYLAPYSVISNCEDPKINRYTKTTECKSENKLFSISDVAFTFKKPIFENSHKTLNGFGNGWIADPVIIEKNYNTKFYKKNKDGSVDVHLTLYFTPQNNFYFGSLISIAFFGIGTIYLLKKRNEKYN